MNIPSGFVQVSRDRFFSVLMAEKRDIMPTSRPDHTLWREQKNHGKLWGWSTPGWQGGSPKLWALRADVEATA